MALSYQSLYDLSKEIIHLYYRAGNTIRELKGSKIYTQQELNRRQREIEVNLINTEGNKRKEFIEEYQKAMGEMDKKLKDIETIKGVLQSAEFSLPAPHPQPRTGISMEQLFSIGVGRPVGGDQSANPLSPAYLAGLADPGNSPPGSLV